jgi:archaellum component FlaC
MASARPKKKGGEAGRSAARHFSVIVEDLLSQFKVFGEALQGLRENMALRFDEIDRRFDGIDDRFERIDHRFDGIDQEILLLKDASLTHTRELKDVNHQLREIRTSVDRLAEKVDQKVDRTEVEAIVERALSRP